MDHLAPKYFYISHLYTSHPLFLQKILSLAKIFTDQDLSSSITHTEIVHGFFSLVVQSPKVIDLRTIKKFEAGIDSTGHSYTELSHATMDINRVGSNYPPTYIFSTHFAHDYGYFTFLFGGGIWFNFKLYRILKKIDGGLYFYKFYKRSFVFLVESTTLFKSEDMEKLKSHLTNPHLKLLTSFSNF